MVRRVRFCAQLTGESYYSASWYMYSVLKKVPEYRHPLYRSTGIWFKKLFLSIVFTILKKSYFLNIQPVYLGFVCDLPPGPWRITDKKKYGQPSEIFGGGCGVRVRRVLRFCAQLTGESYYSTSWYVYRVLKKVPEYRHPLYRSTGFWFKKLFFSIVFTILEKGYFWNIQPVHLGFFRGSTLSRP